MSIKKVKIEKWKSDAGNREDHYYVSENGTLIYFFGYNPEMISPAQLKKIFKILNLCSHAKQQ